MFRITAILTAALCLFATGGAQAQWASKTGDDPITDKKWAATATMFGSFMVTFKCWHGSGIQIAIAVGPYDPGAAYKPTITAKMRVDKGEPIDLKLQPADMAGVLILQATTDEDPNILQLLKAIGAGKQRVVLAIGSAAVQASPQGGAKAVQTMLRVCAIPENELYAEDRGAGA